MELTPLGGPTAELSGAPADAMQVDQISASAAQGETAAAPALVTLESIPETGDIAIPASAAMMLAAPSSTAADDDDDYDEYDDDDEDDE
mmetsp:Transcript_1245/g.4466  ORF Transcript_1245/g.4466 Transcript_1245/m.4466 type:complete len:89 (+) Transcript_1245:1-267(+)